MRIARVLFVPGVSGFFFDDQRAIKRGAPHDGAVYAGAPATEGFRRVREAGRSLSVVLVLDDGQTAVGDCAAVQYSGAGGRDPLFVPERYLPALEAHVRPLLEGAEIEPFLDMAARVEAIEPEEGRRLHTAVRYGVSQALLEARALARRVTKCEVIREEYDLRAAPARVPIFGQSGDDRYGNADKMILKQVDVLPHALINNVEEKLGRRGEKLEEYVRWLVRRIRALRLDPSYRPALHIDVYGTIGIAFGMDHGAIADYLAVLGEAAEEFPLYIEGPVDAEAKGRQIEALAEVRARLRRAGAPVKIVADEWCNTPEDVREFVDAGACDMAQIKTPVLGGVQNTVESVLYCTRRGVEAYQGGTCNETDVSARACVHLAVAAQADRMLAKPGMGFDEGYSIVRNEMERVLALLALRRGPAATNGKG
ncbi:MAG TPA: methylaspartate ammonia-lyase [Planctomycetes bacterium]|nr:methylaspartate ammonia-lyase [Planctomycetota bacterium]